MKTYKCSIYFAGHVDVFVDASTESEASGLVDEAFEALDCREIVAGIEETETQDLEVDACDSR